MEERQIKSCPFCGSTEIVIETLDEGTGIPFCECSSCFASGPRAYTVTAAVILWNGSKDATSRQ